MDIRKLSTTPRPKSPRATSLVEQATDDVGRPRPTSTYECEQFTEDAATPRPTLTAMCVGSRAIFGENASKSADRCVQATDNSGSPRPTSADKVV
ncbi:hypothetical protein H5410_014729 [Solanum commersonii]|uniref:Uncharacterized protein n=1 Tax=Solanum commersonii TaxID=4109 RepID=A0A9J5ZRR9_SOLCO|nr:hypothetical protein H5410_014729 [Solanum commersonii]